MSKLITVVLVASVCLCAWGNDIPAQPATPADTCEFKDAKEAKTFGWEPLPGAAMDVSDAAKIGASALRIDPSPEPKQYMGVGLTHDIDLTGATGNDKIVVFLKQNFGSDICVNLRTAKGNVYRYAKLKHNQWTRLELDLDLAKWSQDNKTPVEAWTKITYLHIYSRGFDKAGEFMLVDGFSVFMKGKPAITRATTNP